MWKRNYSTAKRMHKIIVGKGYTSEEAWSMVQTIFDTSGEHDDLKRRAEMVVGKDKFFGEYVQSMTYAGQRYDF